jgi:hypothetical protein
VTPPVAVIPPVAVAPPVAVTPPVALAPPVAVIPPVAVAPPVAVTPPVAVAPPVPVIGIPAAPVELDPPDPPVLSTWAPPDEPVLGATEPTGPMSSDCAQEKAKGMAVQSIATARPRTFITTSGRVVAGLTSTGARRLRMCRESGTLEKKRRRRNVRSRRTRTMPAAP